ncbi:MAG: hypothetical protein RMM17_08315 [Acidobacteriota bacterium]|nr:hypothetical protein [Blastocatellia bacterium]MDW8412670.1 hypothetical protein [Acidobacteriota bacterium]
MSFWWRLFGEAKKVEFNPGEFEVVRVKAEREWWQAGELIVTNHRLFWFASNSKVPLVELDLREVLGCVKTRSWYYLGLYPSVKVLLSNGSSEQFHAVASCDFVVSQIEQFAGKERYKPGMLFKS